MFRTIITEEEKTMKLNENNEDLHESLNKLRTKCIKSSFNQKLTENHFFKFKRINNNNRNLVKKKPVKIFIGLHSLRNC